MTISNIWPPWKFTRLRATVPSLSYSTHDVEWDPDAAFYLVRCCFQESLLHPLLRLQTRYHSKQRRGCLEKEKTRMADTIAKITQAEPEYALQQRVHKRLPSWHRPAL